MIESLERKINEAENELSDLWDRAELSCKEQDVDELHNVSGQIVVKQNTLNVLYEARWMAGGLPEEWYEQRLGKKP